MNKRVKFFWLAMNLSLVLALTACGGGGSTPDSPPPTPTPTPTFNTYVYVSNADDDTISQFSVSTAAGLAEVLPVAETALASGPNSITASIDGKYVYIVNNADNTIDKFTVGADGALAGKVTFPDGTGTLQGTQPWAMAIEPTGKYAYVTYFGTSEVEQLLIGTNGLLSSSTALPVATGQFPNVVAITDSGLFAYIANSFDDTISLYQIDPTSGAITPLAVPTISTGSLTTPLFLAIDPFGRYLYTANDIGTVGQFSIALDGTLSPIPSPVSITGDPTAIAVDPSGSYVYVTDWLNDSIEQYSIGASGALTLIGSDLTGPSPIGVDIDPEGRFVYTINEDDLISAGSVSQFAINAADGTLATVFTDPFANTDLNTGVSPTWVKTLRIQQ